MSDRLKEIWSGTPQWAAWLKHHRGTKTEACMLVCQANVKPFLAASEWPPEMPRAERLTRSALPAATEELKRGEKPSVEEGQIDRIAGRLEARAKRNAADEDAKKQRNKETRRAEKTFAAASEAMLAGNEPRIDGVDILGTVVVEDPLDHRRRTKVTNLRDDPIGQMHRRGQLLTEDEKKKRVSVSVADVRLIAAREWQALYERAEIGGVRAIDPGKPPVSGGRFAEPDTDGGNNAREQLRALRDRLGMIELTASQRITGERLLIWVLGEKKTIGQVLDQLGLDQRLVCIGRHLIEVLDKAAIGLRVSMRPARGIPRPRDKHDATADRYLRSFQSFTGSDSECPW